MRNDLDMPPQPPNITLELFLVQHVLAVHFDTEGLGVMLDLQSHAAPTTGLRVCLATGDAQRTADALRTLADQLTSGSLPKRSIDLH
jgi:hypothetical protein